MAQSVSASAATEKLLEVDKLGRTFGSVAAVQELSFSVCRGRCVALLGPNGAGKTTTLSMIAGLLPPSSGRLALHGGDGRIVEGDLRSRLGYLPQSPAFYGWMTGKEYMRMIGRLSGLTRKQAADRADTLLVRVGLGDAGSRRIGGYSGGMRQRLGIAQAIVHRPELLILDEPVSALDPVGRREVLDLMAELKGETAILYSTHVLHDAEEISDDVLIMNHGRLAVSGAWEDIRRRHRKPKIEIRAESGLDELMRHLASAPGQLAARCRLSPDGRRLELETSELDRVRDVVMAELTALRVPVVSLSVGETTLEDLFREVVGA